MNKSEIKPWDWARIIIGEVPPIFYVEAIIYAVFLYLLLMIAIRIWGKRMASQLDKIEIAGMVTLAAAIGAPLLTPERGFATSCYYCHW